MRFRNVRTALHRRSALLALVVLPLAAFGQSSGGAYAVLRSTTNGGGASAGGAYRVEGVIGEAAGGRSAGGNYAVASGYAAVAAPTGGSGEALFSNGFE